MQHKNISLTFARSLRIMLDQKEQQYGIKIKTRVDHQKRISITTTGLHSFKFGYTGSHSPWESNKISAEELFNWLKENKFSRVKIYKIGQIMQTSDCIGTLRINTATAWDPGLLFSKENIKLMISPLNDKPGFRLFYCDKATPPKSTTQLKRLHKYIESVIDKKISDTYYTPKEYRELSTYLMEKSGNKKIREALEAQEEIQIILGNGLAQSDF